MASPTNSMDLISLIDTMSTSFLRQEGMAMFALLLLLTGSISLLAKIFTSFKDKKEIDWIGWILDVLGVVCVAMLVTVFFKAIIWLMSSIATAIYPYDEWKQLFKEYLNYSIVEGFESTDTQVSAENRIENLKELLSNIISWTSITLDEIRSSIFNFVFWLTSITARLCFWGLLAWKGLYLLVLFILSYIHIAKSLLPSYGLKSLFDYIQEVIQVSSWSIYFAAGLLALKNIHLMIVDQPLAMGVGFLYDASQVVITNFLLQLVFIVYVLSIPKFASKHFGGIDTSAVLYGAAALPFAMASLGNNFMRIVKGGVSIAKGVSSLKKNNVFSKLGGSNETA